MKTEPMRPRSNWAHVERSASLSKRITVFRGTGAGKVKRRKVTGFHKFMDRTEREKLCRVLEWDHRQGVK